MGLRTEPEIEIYQAFYWTWDGIPDFFLDG